jgi:hypothetical protein
MTCRSSRSPSASLPAPPARGSRERAIATELQFDEPHHGHRCRGIRSSIALFSEA